MARTAKQGIQSKNPYGHLSVGDTTVHVEESAQSVRGETRPTMKAGYGRYTRAMGRIGTQKQYKIPQDSSTATVPLSSKQDTGTEGDEIRDCSECGHMWSATLDDTNATCEDCRWKSEVLRDNPEAEAK